MQIFEVIPFVKLQNNKQQLNYEKWKKKKKKRDEKQNNIFFGWAMLSYVWILF